MARRPSTLRAMHATATHNQAKPRTPTLTSARKAVLLALAQRIVDNSTSEQAEGFNTERWLDQWLLRPQPALDGARPIDLLGAEAGAKAVRQVLVAMESGSYL